MQAVEVGKYENACFLFAQSNGAVKNFLNLCCSADEFVFAIRANFCQVEVQGAEKTSWASLHENKDGDYFY